MGVWTVTSDGTPFCARHDRPFTKGAGCPGCYTDPPPEDEDLVSEIPNAEGLPGSVDHERWYVAASDRFKDEAEALLEDQKPQRKTKSRPGKKGRKANPQLAAKLMEVAIKARRAAVEITKWREDWEQVHELEEELRKMRGAH